MFGVESEGYRKDATNRKIRTEISPDRYEAWVTVLDENCVASEVLTELQSNRVVHGINRDAVETALARVGERTMVASGTRHVDGKNGWLERNDPAPLTDAEQRLGIKNIHAGELIGTIHNPVPGSEGKDIFGGKVQPKRGEAFKVFTGPTVKRMENEECISLFAGADGNLKVGPSGIEILVEHIIHQDVDYSDGEVEFAGSLRVTGDVKGSCSINVGHDVSIQGSVEDARIIAGGNVVVKGSFVGRGEGLIRAKGNVEVHVVLNQMIEAGGSITITKESVNAHLIAADAVYGPNAVIMGGTVAAGEKIEVLTLGGELYSTTRAKLGENELASEDESASEKEIEIQKKVCEDLKNEVYLLVRDRVDGNNFTPEKAEKLKSSQAKLQEITELIKTLTQKKHDVAMEHSRKHNPRLVVLGTIHQSVALEINGIKMGVKQSFNKVTFEVSNNEIVRTKNL